MILRNISSNIGPVFVTGATGFIGNAIMRSLRTNRIEAIDLREVLRTTGLLVDQRYLKAEEIFDLGMLPAAIVHCAGNSSIRTSFEDSIGDMRANLQQVGELLEYVRRAGSDIRLVQFSTSAIYGNAYARSEESMKAAPVSPYALHKLMAEESIAFYGRVYGVRSAILRPFSVYGAGQRKQLIWDALCRFERNDSHFHGGAENLRDFIDVRDVASFVPFAIAAADVDAPVFNVSTGVGTSVRDALGSLAQLARAKSPVTFGDTVWPGDPRVLVGANDRAKALGWTPKIELQQGLAEVVAWFEGEARA